MCACVDCVHLHAFSHIIYEYMHHAKKGVGRCAPNL